jgi:hypothetical protein
MSNILEQLKNGNDVSLPSIQVNMKYTNVYEHCVAKLGLLPSQNLAEFYVAINSFLDDLKRMESGDMNANPIDFKIKYVGAALSILKYLVKISREQLIPELAEIAGAKITLDDGLLNTSSGIVSPVTT